MAHKALPGRDSFDAATNGLLFTKDFHQALEGVMRDTEATTAQRVLAWAKRRAWGNYSLFCIREDGKPATQADCCHELQLDKTRVSHTLADYERRGYVRLEGKVIYPEIDPHPKPQKVADSRNFQAFLEFWKVADSRNFRELEDARSTIKRIRKVALDAYKKWRDAGNSGAASLSETVQTVETVNERTSEAAAALVEDTTSSPAGSSVRPADPKAGAEPAAPSIREQLAAWLAERTDRFGLLTRPDATAIRAIAAEIPDQSTLERFKAQVEKQKPRPKSWKYFVAIAKACAAAEAESNRIMEQELKRLRKWNEEQASRKPAPEDDFEKPAKPEPAPAAHSEEEAERKANARATARARREAAAKEAEENKARMATLQKPPASQLAEEILGKAKA